MRKLNQENLVGVWSAIPTPFTSELELDTESVSRLVEHQVRLGIKGLFVASPNGEGHLMSDSMRMELAKEMVKNNHERMLLSMQVKDNSVKLMLDDIKCMKDCGIDIAVINFPLSYIIEPKLEYIQRLYLSVLEKSVLPIAVCHVSGFPFILKSILLLEEICFHPKVVLVKDCSGGYPEPTKMFMKSFRKHKELLPALAGTEFECIPYVKSDYDGLLLGSACFTGFVAGEILDLAKDKRMKDAQKIQDYMNSLLVDVFGLELEHYLVGQKQMMVELGIFNTAKTLQNYPVSEELINTIKEIVRQEKEYLLSQIKHSKTKRMIKMC
jgi:dihydrodipicolinate synthase/N-acetylneuraminate lyase